MTTSPEQARTEGLSGPQDQTGLQGQAGPPGQTGHQNHTGPEDHTDLQDQTGLQNQTGLQGQTIPERPAGKQGQACPDPASAVLWKVRPDMRIYALMAVFGALMSFYPVLRLLAAVTGSGAPLPTVEIAFALIAVAVFLVALFMLVVILLGGLVMEYRLEPGTFYVEQRFLGRFRSRAYAVPGVHFFRARKFSCLVQAGIPAPDGSWPASSTITLFSAAQRDSLRRALPEGTLP